MVTHEELQVEREIRGSTRFNEISFVKEIVSVLLD